VVTRFLHILIHCVSAAFVGTLIVAALDLTIALVWGLHPPPASLAGWSIASVAASWFVPSMIVGSLLSVGVMLFSIGGQGELAGDLELARARIHGPSGGWPGTAIWIASATCLYGVVAWFMTDQLDRYTEAPSEVALILSGVLTVVLIWLAHRIVVAKFERAASRPVPLGLFFVVVTAVTIAGPIRTLQPELMPLGVLAVAFWAAYTSIIGLKRLDSRFMYAPIAFSALCLLVATLTLEHRSGAHAWLSRHLKFHGASLSLTQVLFDLDFDGHASRLGGADCNDGDPRIHPQAAEVVGNGIDDNCIGGDLDGEAFGEGGVHWHLHHAIEPIIRVPWFIRVPGRDPAVTTGPTSLVHFRPTLHSILGLDVEGSGEPLERGHAQRPVFVASNPRKEPGVWIVLEDDWKLHYDRKHAAWSLYDLSEDPEELVNLVDSHPAVFERLRHKLGTWRDETYNSEQLDRKSKRYPSRKRFRPDYLEGVLHETSKL